MTKAQRESDPPPESPSNGEVAGGTEADDNLQTELDKILNSGETIPPQEAGAIVDDEVAKAENVVSIKDGPKSRSKDEEAKTRPPLVDEWQAWLSKTVLRAGTDWYLAHAFVGIDEDALTEREVNQLRLGEEERDRIAKPIAEFLNKWKFARKHGRMVVATTGSFESLLTLGQWVARVNRISLKYRRRQAGTVQGEVVNDGNTRQSTPPTANGQSRTSRTIFNPGTG